MQNFRYQHHTVPPDDLSLIVWYSDDNGLLSLSLVPTVPFWKLLWTFVALVNEASFFLLVEAYLLTFGKIPFPVAYTLGLPHRSLLFNSSANPVGLIFKLYP